MTLHAIEQSLVSLWQPDTPEAEAARGALHVFTKGFRGSDNPGGKTVNSHQYEPADLSAGLVSCFGEVPLVAVAPTALADQIRVVTQVGQRSVVFNIPQEPGYETPHSVTAALVTEQVAVFCDGTSLGFLAPLFSQPNGEGVMDRGYIATVQGGQLVKEWSNGRSPNLLAAFVCAQGGVENSPLDFHGLVLV